VFVKNLTDSAIQLAVRPWATNEDFSYVFTQTLEDCKMHLTMRVLPFNLCKRNVKNNVE
jgi:hypothetical protein